MKIKKLCFLVPLLFSMDLPAQVLPNNGTVTLRDAYRKQFDIGQRTLLDVLDTENELFSARRAYANAEYDREIAYARVHAATGSLFATLGLSRGPVAGVKESQPDGAEVIGACPLEGPGMYMPDKHRLNERAMELLKESATPPQQEIGVESSTAAREVHKVENVPQSDNRHMKNNSKK